MKAVMAECSEDKRLYEVFAPSSIALLEETLTFIENFKSTDELEARKEEFAEVSFIFSTWGAPILTEEEVKTYFPALKAYFYGAGTVQYFAKPYMKNKVRIFSAASANSVPVAEYVIAQILLANKGFYQTCRLYTNNKHEEAMELRFEMPGNYDETIGFIGAGKIAADVITRLKDYRLNAIVYDPYLSDARAEELGVTKVSLEELFANSITISNHLPNNDETQSMLGYELFSLMQPYATFLNTGRGAQVIEADLVRALKEVPTRTAVLDVTDPEPAEAGHDFYSMDNVFLTPHIAGSNGNELRRMGQHMAEEYLRFINGEAPLYEVTEAMLATMA